MTKKVMSQKSLMSTLMKKMKSRKKAKSKRVLKKRNRRLKVEKKEK